jgi:hypothetical protein
MDSGLTKFDFKSNIKKTNINLYACFLRAKPLLKNIRVKTMARDIEAKHMPRAWKQG